MTDPISRLNAALDGRYTIERELGQGGMATVYLADDLRHDRKVALKVLKPELAAVVGADRFLAEIKTTAGLQHPNILPLFDSGEADSFLYYVMPYVQEETLADRLQREKQLPIDEAVRITREVADALQAAHDQGVIHRDIKPANILLSRGRPLVADFGIALAVSAAGGGRLTETGLSLGTPHYMSPEQATGDHDPGPRSDIYSLGCVLYEMLAGQPPHVAGTAQAILASILTGGAKPVTEFRESTPPNVEHALRKSLERVAADRFASAAAFVKALDDPTYRSSATAAAEAATAAGSVSHGRHRIWQIATAALAVAVGWFALGPSPEPTAPSFEFEADLGVQVRPVPGILLEPDGSVLFTQDDFSPRRVLRRTPGSVSVREANLPEESFRGVHSPDGRFIAHGPGGITRTSVDGAQSVVLYEIEGRLLFVRIASWSDDGWIHAKLGGMAGGNIVRFRDDGSAIDTIFDLSGIDSGIGRLSPLPGGAFLATRHPTSRTFVADTTSVMILDPASGDTATIIERGAQAHWVDTGHIVYLEPSGEVMALPFNTDLRAAAGPAFPLGIETGGWDAAWPLLDVSGDRLAYIRNTTPLLDRRAVEWFDPSDGSLERLPLPTQLYERVLLSTDGQRLLVTDGLTVRESWVHEFSGNRRVPLPQEYATNPEVVWSPDGSTLAYAEGSVIRFLSGPSFDQIDEVDVPLPPNAAAGWLMYQWPQPDLILASVAFGGSLSWEQQQDVYVLERADGSWSARPLMEAPWSELVGGLSPSGSLLAVVAQGDSSTLSIVSYPSLAPGPTVRTIPLERFDQRDLIGWAPDGASLFYVDDEEVREVEVIEDGPSVRLGEVRAVFPQSRLSDRRWAGMGQDGRLLTLVGVDAAAGLDPSERNRLMMVTGLKERIRRLDPGLGGR